MCKEKIIYKYYPCNNFNIESLLFGYLWFSKPQYFNDPFDCNFDHVPELSFYKSYTQEQKEKLLESFKSFGVCCFSHDGMGEHFWSLYASNYSGFSVAFDLKELRKYFLIYGIYNDSIDYKETPIDIESDIKEYHTDFYHNIEQVLRKCIFRKKSNPWEVENEERFFMGLVPISNINKGECLAIKEEKGYKVPFPIDCVKEIVVGHNIEDIYLKKIKRIRDLRYTDIEIYQLEVDSKNWKLIKKKL